MRPPTCSVAAIRSGPTVAARMSRACATTTLLHHQVKSLGALCHNTRTMANGSRARTRRRHHRASLSLVPSWHCSADKATRFHPPPPRLLVTTLWAGANGLAQELARHVTLRRLHHHKTTIPRRRVLLRRARPPRIHHREHGAGLPSVQARLESGLSQLCNVARATNCNQALPAKWCVAATACGRIPAAPAAAPPRMGRHLQARARHLTLFRTASGVSLPSDPMVKA